MVSIVFYFQVHQPFRIADYRIFDIGSGKSYFNNERNRHEMRKIAEKCYLPTNRLMLELINRYPKFKISYSITGTAIEQFKEFAPEVLQSFKDLAETGNVEFLNETYYHSLSYLYNKEEFWNQVKMHAELIKKEFGFTPTSFRNTELIFHNELAADLYGKGYKAVIAEGADHIMGWKSPNYVYKTVSSDMKVLLKNYKLSDDIAFRFSNRGWNEWPLTVEKYAQWINSINGSGEIVNLFMDYETFGEHQWADTGIFDFMRALPGEILKHSDNNFLTPSEAADKYPIRGDVDFNHYVSWADMERDLTAWLGNRMQDSSMRSIFDFSEEMKGVKNEAIISDWRKLQTSDHFYYMCTKWFNDGDVHKYFNPHESPYDAFMSYMSIMEDLKKRVEAHKQEIVKGSGQGPELGTNEAKIAKSSPSSRGVAAKTL